MGLGGPPLGVNRVNAIPHWEIKIFSPLATILNYFSIDWAMSIFLFRVYSELELCDILKETSFRSSGDQLLKEQKQLTLCFTCKNSGEWSDR